MNKPMPDSRSFEVLTASPVRLSSPARSYRSWSDEEKARIVGQTLVGGANDCAVKWAGSVTTFCMASQGDSLWGGCAIGRIATLLPTAKMNDVDPLTWLALTLELHGLNGLSFALTRLTSKALKEPINVLF